MMREESPELPRCLLAPLWKAGMFPANVGGARYDPAVPNEFETLRDRLRGFAEARNWGKSHSPRNLALAIAGEVGELSAELQWISDENVTGHLQDPEARARVADEVADVLIYLIRFADVCGIDPLVESNAKIDRNEVRFPTEAGTR